ncbi:C25 family cysteine peptidase [Arundinibacter roseus]|uniref:Uncharacterized protein n=1 Tax=Arundinibacter roseus TaxID=2070510 RepID=A0A4R4JYT6_9BACT|nr:C25 family cysteine peptidase [Arundinibacter roseus]TDB60090.1 hypothetical protein EZE20_21705 [Arundinibacter roseus]
MLVFRLLWLFIIISFSVSAQQRRLEIDSITNQYKVITTVENTQDLRIANDGIDMEVTLNPLKPSTAVDITLHFSDQIDLSLIDNFYFTAQYDCYPIQSCGIFSVYLSITSNLIDHDSRSIKCTVEGLKPGMRFRITSIIWGLDGDPCSSEHVYYRFITTLPESEGVQKKLLLVINEEWENHAGINVTIDQYSQDLKRTMNMEIEKYYIGTSIPEKVELLDYVKNKYFDDNLTHLFFIGSNAAVPIATIVYDEANQIGAKYTGSSFTWYTNLWYSSYVLDPVGNEFISSRYQNTCYRAPEEIRNPVFQQSSSAISFGMLLPNPAHDQHQMADKIIAYFDKLHRYKNYEIEFDKKVLTSDGFASDLESVQKIHNGRWTAVDTVQFGRVKDLYYSGNDFIWKEDYFKKIQRNSYEIFNFNGHGSPNYHSFGVGNSEVSGLDTLNIQIMNFHSCEIGKFNRSYYLANEYLERGNVLAVHAYSQLFFQATIGNESALARDFRVYGPFGWMANGSSISDAFRYGNGYNDSEIILGDPLLKLREFCGPVVYSQTSGNWHDRTTWVCGHIPTIVDNVHILPGHVINLENQGESRKITIEGTLNISQNGTLSY